MTGNALASTLAPWHRLLRRPEPLHPGRHAELTLRQGDFGFAAGTHLVPILLAEIPAAAANHPIVVVGEPSPGLAILVGLEPQRNLIVRNGSWLQGWYLPLSLRLYPLAPANDAGAPGALPLAADLASNQLSVGGAGERLFVDGRPGRELAERLKLAHLLVEGIGPTRDFARALIDSGVASKRRVAQPDPTPELDAVAGILSLDARALGKLPERRIVDWHRRGWIAAAVLMLHSERHVALLSALRGGLAPPQRCAPVAFAPSAIV